jgi:uncharacterized protein (TIGR03067 family)
MFSTNRRYVMRIKAAMLMAFVFASAAVVVAGDGAKTELKRFAGKWSVVSARANGKDLPEEETKEMHFTFRENTLTSTKAGKPVEATIKLDPSKKPKHINLLINGKETSGIYQFDGKRLQLAFGEPRPTEFKSVEGSGRLLLILSRGQN